MSSGVGACIKISECRISGNDGKTPSVAEPVEGRNVAASGVEE
jgi:hypothetical protein